MFFIDVQGTLIDDIKKEPIEGTIELINRLNREKIPYLVVTNNTKEESHKFLTYLNSIGFEIPKERYLDPLMVLDEVVKSRETLAFGVDSFLETLQERGYKTSSQSPQTLLLGVKHNYSSDEYATIIETILNNSSIQLVGMHGTSIYSKHGKRYPGVGAILQMLKFATGKESDVVGKPSRLFYQKALEMIEADSFRDITMVSDDFTGDLRGAKELGMRTVLVLSGKIKHIDELSTFDDEVERPDSVMDKLNSSILSMLQ